MTGTADALSPAMTFDYVAGAALALLLTGYLLYALLWPERF